MKSTKVCEYSRSRSFHYDLILQDQASGERSQDQWSSGFKRALTNTHILAYIQYMMFHYLIIRGCPFYNMIVPVLDQTDIAYGLPTTTFVCFVNPRLMFTEC